MKQHKKMIIAQIQFKRMNKYYPITIPIIDPVRILCSWSNCRLFTTMSFFAILYVIILKEQTDEGFRQNHKRLYKA